MQLFRRVVAVLLLALWLPATAHCRLEAAGAQLGSDCCAKPAAAPDEGCATDVCKLLGGLMTKPAATGLGVFAPLLCDGLHCGVAIAPVSIDWSPSVTGVAEVSTAPPEIRQSYHFVFRTALPARAPDSAS